MEECIMGKVILDQLRGVRNFPGLNKDDLLVKGQTEDYVPVFLKVNWFYSVFQNGRIDTEMLTNIDDSIRLGMCTFKATIYADENRVISTGHGTSPVQMGVYDSFIQVAEGHAISRALNHGGFNWHSGDFSKQELQNGKNPYLSYINHSNILEINATTKVLFAEAMSTILPEGYGAFTGKPLSEASVEWISTMAKNYGTLSNGDPLINDMVYFVYIYSMMISENAEQDAPVNQQEIKEKKAPVEPQENKDQKTPVEQQENKGQNDPVEQQENKPQDTTIQQQKSNKQNAPVEPQDSGKNKQKEYKKHENNAVQPTNKETESFSDDEVFFAKTTYAAYLAERKLALNKLLQEGNDEGAKALINETIAPVGYPDAQPEKKKTTLSEIFKNKKSVVRQVYEQKTRSTYSTLDYFVRSFPF